MSKMIDVVGTITFDEKVLNVYVSLNQPMFRATDIAKMIEYSEGNTWKLLELCEEDEKLNLPVVVAGQKRNVSFVNEEGLYNILEQSRKPIARKFRKVLNKQLVRMRNEHNRNITEQFDEWNAMLDDLYWDEETQTLMQSITVAGGDVDQIPFDGWEMKE